MEIFTRDVKMLDKEIERVLKELSETPLMTEDYVMLTNNLSELTKARERKNTRAISSEMLLAAGVNIITMLLILNFEKTGVITSKAFNLFGRKTL